MAVDCHGRGRLPFGGLDLGGHGKVVRNNGDFLLLPAAHLWNGPIPTAGNFPIENAISMRIMIAGFILAIAFRKIHRTGRDAALAMGIMAEHLLRGARLTEIADLTGPSVVPKMPFMGSKQWVSMSSAGTLPATHLPEEMHKGHHPLLS